MADVTDLLRRESIRWDIYYPEAFTNWKTPTVAELNGPLGLNITCAVAEPDTTFTLGDSELDGDYSYCDASGIDRPTFYAPEAALGIYRDTERAAAGVFNAALALWMFPDKPFYIVKRVGNQLKNASVAYAVGDRIKMQFVKTDLPVDALGGGENARMTQAFSQQGQGVNWNYNVAA